MRKTDTLAIALGLILSSGASAVPITYNILQEGYDEGARVTGFFTGDDIDMDGKLSYFAGAGDPFAEVFDFQMEFSGNSTVPLFTLGFSELFALAYDLDGGPLGDSPMEGIQAFSATNVYAVGPSSSALCGGSPSDCVSDPTNQDFTQELVDVTAVVPIPGTLALLAIGGIAAGASRRNSRRGD